MSESPLNTARHDLPVSDALAEFMKHSWASSESPDVAPLELAAYTAKRRSAVSAAFPGETLVVASGGLKVRANDTDYPFRPGSDFVWLTGEMEPDGVLVMTPVSAGHAAELYVRPRSPRSSGAEFYRDRRYGDFWAGRLRSLAESEALLGLPCRHLSSLPEALGALRGPVRVLRGYDAVVDAAVPGDELRDGELAAVLSELRLVKDDWEIAQIQQAVDATVRGFEDVVRELPAAVATSERWIEGVFYRRARVEGNAVGYDTIAAAGANACVLHWIRNDGPVRPGELLLLDAGVENKFLYTADITRTLPISGRFSPVQRQVYQLVYEAQEAALACVKPGASFRDFHRAAMAVIASGLADWGVLKVSAEESLSPSSGLHRRYTLCSSGHMLGLDVHDCANARAATYLDGKLEVGHVLTVEPGLYFQPDDLTLPPELRGIGVRIEDDLLVTEDGYRLLSSALPRHPDEVEAWMAEPHIEM